MEKKIVNGMALTAAYDAFRVLTDPMNNYSHELDLGVKSLDECREAAIRAHAGREALEECFIEYYRDHGELSSEAAEENIHLLREYVPAIMFDPEFNIEVVKGYQRAGTLHQICTILKPVSLQQWNAMIAPLKQLDTFRRDLKTYKPDDVIVATRQRNAIKETIVNLKAKLQVAEANPTDQDFFSVKLLVQDLTKIQADICTAIQNGMQWTAINYSCTRDELDKWRVTASSILNDLDHIKKGQETQKAAISETYKTNVVVAKFPKIKNRQDWAEIMLRWKKEECHLLDEFSKLAALRTSLVIPEGIELGKSAANWRQLYSQLTAKYGYFDRIVPTLLKELDNLPTPGSEKDERYLKNLVRLDSIIKVLTDENEQSMLDCMLVERITKAAFPENNHREYNVSFLAASKLFTKLGVEARLITEEEGMKCLRAKITKSNAWLCFEPILKNNSSSFTSLQPELLISKLGSPSTSKTPMATI